MKTLPNNDCNWQRGFSYIEVLIAALIMSAALVPALDALKPGIQGSALHRQSAILQYALLGKMEEVLAQSFDDLDSAATAAGAPTTPTAYSDITPTGITRNVYIWRYDADDADDDDDMFTGVESDILWLQVSLPGYERSLQTLHSLY